MTWIIIHERTIQIRVVKNLHTELNAITTAHLITILPYSTLPREEPATPTY